MVAIVTVVVPPLAQIVQMVVKLLVMQLALISAQALAYRTVKETVLRVVPAIANQVVQGLLVLPYLNL